MSNSLSGVFAKLVGKRITKRSSRLNVCAREEISVLVKVLKAVKMLSITCIFSTVLIELTNRPGKVFCLEVRDHCFHAHFELLEVSD